MDGHKFKQYHGEEHVNFVNGDMQGYFNHDSVTIRRIVCNYTSRKDLAVTLREIAKYCRVGFNQTRGRTFNQMAREAAENMDEFRQMLGIKLPLRIDIKSYPHKIGILELRQEVEALSCPEVFLEIDKDENLKNMETRQSIFIEPVLGDIQLGHQVTMPKGPLDFQLEPHIRLTRILRY